MNMASALVISTMASRCIDSRDCCVIGVKLQGINAASIRSMLSEVGNSDSAFERRCAAHAKLASVKITDMATAMDGFIFEFSIVLE